MANALLCDSCGNTITDANNRASMLIYTTDAIADPSLDLCGDCLATFIDNPAIQKARTTARRRVYEHRAVAMGMTAEELAVQTGAEL